MKYKTHDKLLPKSLNGNTIYTRFEEWRIYILYKHLGTGRGITISIGGDLIQPLT